MTHSEGDFYAKYAGLNPNYYSVNVCPQCGYAYLDKTTPKIPKHKKQEYIENVFPRWNPRDFGSARSTAEAITSFKLAVFCSQYFGDATKTIGGQCLQLAWLYRELENEEQDLRFLQEALYFYTNAFEKDANIEDDGRMTYLLGELNRRLGNEHEAARFFMMVIRDTTATGKYQRMARDQYELLREEMRESKTG